jgi:IS5 family transposase
VGQRGFWDEHQRVSKLQGKKPVLKRLSESIPWESFRPLLDQRYALERKSNAGRKRINPLILFKMLVLQQLFNISDEELEFQVNDRRSDSSDLVNSRSKHLWLCRLIGGFFMSAEALQSA